MKIKVVDIPGIICFIALLTIYYIPDTLILMGISIRNLILIILTITFYLFNINKIYLLEIAFLMFIILISFIHKTISYIHLLNLINIYKMYKYRENIKKYIFRNKKIYFLLVGVIIYSLAYFGKNGRYIYTSTFDINQSGYALLLLFLIIRVKNKRIGNGLLVLGLLTFSKSYLLGVVIFILLNKLNRHNLITNKVLKIFTFKNLMIISFIILLALSHIYIYMEQHGEIYDYSEGINRYTSIFDYSNYFRFTANENLLIIFKENPELLLTGMTTEEFFENNFVISSRYNRPYRAIKPHNYFFSYLRIYGIFSMVIFIFNSKIMKIYVNKNNFSIFIILFSYLTFLGVGLNNIWIYLTIITLIIYNDREIKNEDFNINKNF